MNQHKKGFFLTRRGIEAQDALKLHDEAKAQRIAFAIGRARSSLRHT